MPERGPAIQSRGILTALRAAAIVIIATGLNDVVAGALPRYEPLYLYLAAVALVVLLDGVLLGAGTAVIAVAFYGLLFTPRPLRLAPQVIPLLAAFATVVLAGIIRIVVRRVRRRRLVYEPPVATIIPAEPALLPPPRFAGNDDVLQAIDDLRGELRDREALLERSFLQAREALFERTRIAEEESAHAHSQLAALQSEVEGLRGALEGTRAETLSRDTELAALRAAAEELRRANEIERTRADGEHALRASAVERVAEVERALAAGRARIAELEQSLAGMSAAHAHAEQEAQNTIADAATQLAELQITLATTRANEDAAETELVKLRGHAGELERLREEEHAAAETRIRELETALAAAQRTAAETAARVAALQQTLDTTRMSADTATAELEPLRSQVAEMERALEEERAATQRVTADAEARIAGLQQALAAAHAGAEAVTAELEPLHARISELESAVAAERNLRAADAAEYDRRLDTISTRLAQDHEAGLGKAVEEREEARAEARSLALRITDLESALAAATQRMAEAEGEGRESDELRARIAELENARDAERGEFDQKLNTIVTHLAQDHEADLGKAVEEREEARAEARSLAIRISELERALAAATQRMTEAEGHGRESDELRARIAELEIARDAERQEFDQKLNTIVTHLAQDHEADLGKAVEEREEARAEARSLAIRISELERALDAATQQRLADAEGHGRESDELRARIAELESARDAERQEFDQKLNTIVTHLAQDHEADLGKAVEEREEARAEARSLAIRLTTLQKKYEDERQLAARLLGEMRTAGQAEIDRLRAQIAILHAKQQAMPQSPAQQPVAASPAAQPVRPRILIAHPDADLRMNARASLERAGYEIVSAADGLEALRTAIAQRPDVVIADAVMPKMDGRELCQLLKSQEKTAHIRVILLMRPTDQAPKGELMPDEVLRKPVPLETLKATLAGLLGERV